MTPSQEIYRRGVLSTAYGDFEKSLNSHAYFRVHDQATSENLVQDTFLKTWAYMVKGGKIETMKAFLYHILNNLIVDEYRKRKSTSLDALMEKGFEPAEGSQERAFTLLEGKATILLINQLPEIYRNVINMRYVQDLSLEEMSALTGQTRNTMAVQIHRGLAKLRILYKPAK